jgi:hypothetical protein
MDGSACGMTEGKMTPLRRAPIAVSARSDQVESPGRKELAQDQWLEHDLFAKVVSTFADHALGKLISTDSPPL